MLPSQLFADSNDKSNSTEKNSPLQPLVVRVCKCLSCLPVQNRHEFLREKIEFHHINTER